MQLTLPPDAAAAVARLSQCIAFGGHELIEFVYSHEKDRGTPWQQCRDDFEAVGQAVIAAYRQQTSEEQR